jgi:hypothetical protein
MKKNFTRTYKSIKTFEAALQRNTKLNQNFIRSETGKTSAEFLTVVGLGASLVVSCAFAGGKTGTYIAGPVGAKIGASFGAALGLAAAITATHFYYTVKMNKDGTLDVSYTQI